jgi:hypothetical protein
MRDRNTQEKKVTLIKKNMCNIFDSIIHIDNT